MGVPAGQGEPTGFRLIVFRLGVVHSRYASASSGENIVVERELAALRRRGVEVVAISANGGEIHGRQQFSAAFRVSTGRGKSPDLDGWGGPFDLLHVHNLFPSWSTNWLGKQSLPPLVQTVHNFRAVCAAASLYRDGHKCMDCVTRSPVQGFRHACYRDSRLVTLPLTVNHLLQGGRRSLKLPDRLLFPSRAALELAFEAGVDVSQATVSPPFFAPGAPAAAPRTGFVFVGRLSPEKGVLELIHAWPSEYELTLIGDGPLGAAVASAARGRREIKVVGHLEPAAVAEYVSGAEALVFPSLAMETFGLVYGEALAAGTPVIARQGTVVAGLVADEGTGAVYADERSLPVCLAAVRNSQSQLSRSCRRVFEQQYNEAAWWIRTRATYESLLGKPID